MDTQTTIVAETGNDSAAPQNSAAAGDNVSSDQRRQQFIEAARARREAAAKPAKEQTAPAKEPDATPEAPADETTTEAAPTDQAKETQPEKTDTAPEAEDPVLSQFDPRAREKIQKRINTYVARAKAAEEKVKSLEAKAAEADTLKAQFTQLQQQAAQQKPAEQAAPVRPPVLDPSDPAANANSEEDLVKLQTDAKDMLLLYDRNRRLIDRAVEAGDEKVAIAGKEYEVSVLESGRELALKVIGDSIPKRQKYLQEKTQFDQYAKSINPDAFDMSKQDAIEMRGFLQANPEVFSSSKANLIAALVIKGKRALEAEQKAATEKSATKKAPEQKPPDLGESSAVVSKTAERSSGTSHLDKEIREAQRRYSDSGSIEDRTKLDRLRTARRKAAQ